jgi:hypothetical protein
MFSMDLPFDRLTNDELADHVAELRRQRAQLGFDVSHYHRMLRHSTPGEPLRGTASRQLSEVMSRCRALDFSLSAGEYELRQRLAREARPMQRSNDWDEPTQTDASRCHTGAGAFSARGGGAGRGG